jgi:hypothetical protein
VKKIKQWMEECREQRHVHSDDLDKIIRRCKQKYSHLFPNYDCRKNGSRSVHHFNVLGVPPISLERVHGNREYVPPTYVKYVLDGLDSLVDYIEMNCEDEINDNDNDSGNDGSKDDDS